MNPTLPQLNDEVTSSPQGRASPRPTVMVRSISWERVRLTVDVEVVEPQQEVLQADAQLAQSATAEYSFRITEGKRTYRLDSQHVGEGRHRITLNITNFHQRRQVPNGTWRLRLYLDGHRGPAAAIDLHDVDGLDDRSRVFMYDRNRTCYTVSFGISEHDRSPEFLIRTYQMFAANPRSAKRPGLRTRLKRQLRKRRKDVVRVAYNVARRLNPPKGNRILFASEQRKAIGGNLLTLRDRMIERGLDKQFEIRYSFRTGRTSTRRNMFRLVYLMATSDIILIDDYFAFLERVDLDPSTKLIQVWHAGSGFKSVGLSRFGRFGSPRIVNPHRKYTYAITGSRHLVPVYAESFGIDETAVIPTGLPRIDSFLDPKRTARVLADFDRDYPTARGKKRILFAPTFRGRGSGDAYYDFDKIDFQRLYDFCGDDAVVLFRMHHFIHQATPIPPELSDRLLDLSGYPDTNDLLHASDVLITDYSSIIYEYSLLKRPMLFFAYDKLVYSATRGFHRDYDETAPGKVCETFDELIEALQAEDYELDRIDQFLEDNFDQIDTGSSDRVIDWLILGDPPSTSGGEPALGAARNNADKDVAAQDVYHGDTVPEDRRVNA